MGLYLVPVCGGDVGLALPDASGRRVRVAGKERAWKGGRPSAPAAALPPEALAGRQHPCPALPCRGSVASVSLSIQSEVSFEGAYGNLKRLYDKAARMHQQLKKCETRRLSPSRKR